MRTCVTQRKREPILHYDQVSFDEWALNMQKREIHHILAFPVFPQSYFPRTSALGLLGPALAGIVVAQACSDLTAWAGQWTG